MHTYAEIRSYYDILLVYYSNSNLIGSESRKLAADIYDGRHASKRNGRSECKRSIICRLASWLLPPPTPGSIQQKPLSFFFWLLPYQQLMLEKLLHNKSIKSVSPRLKYVRI